MRTKPNSSNIINISYHILKIIYKKMIFSLFKSICILISYLVNLGYNSMKLNLKLISKISKLDK